MSMTIWKRGRRLFSTAAMLMILTATVHTLGNLSSHLEPAEEIVFAAMGGLQIPLGMGMAPSLLDIFWDLTFTMSLTFAALGMINLVIAGCADVPDRALRRVAWANFVWVGVFVAMGWKYRIPPPLISGVVIEVLVLASILVRPKAA